jgi:hypothetical protein
MAKPSKKSSRSISDSSYPRIADDIIGELYRCAELLNADEELLSLIGSWNETLPDETVLQGLRFWVKCKKSELRRLKINKPSKKLQPTSK